MQLGIKKEVLLPKAVIIILEGDLLQAANHYDKGLSKLLAPWVHWIMTEIHRATTAYKEKLPPKK